MILGPWANGIMSSVLIADFRAASIEKLLNYGEGWDVEWLFWLLLIFFFFTYIIP